ncbi:MAG: serine/threonine protein kinase [Planctomycetes bacterium]|nr:serine/threonine protein kinase [Planctomycetota bacterium]
MLDRPGLDTELARLLHRTERFDLAALRGSLDEARRGRGGAGSTLARVLVDRGLVTEAELAPLLAQLAPPSTGRLPAVQPPPAHRPTGRMTARPSGSWEVRPSEASHGPRAAGDRPELWRPGGRVGDHVLERQVGAGAMGVVFVARHVHTGGRHAVKTLRTTAEPALVERFRREGEAQAKVDGHPNVARVHSMGEAHGRLYLVMELVEGGNLEERVKRGTPPWPEAARIAAGIARGLAHMHGRGVLHRDLKPSNVLFDAAGAPKLVDFGLARFAGADRLTLTGEVLGTPAYMAPEQAMGRHDELGPWTDSWALGGVLLFLLTGQPPFDGVTSLSVITRVAEEEAPAPRALRGDVPAELDALCRALMRRDPRQRPSPAEAAEALEAYAARAAQPGAPPPAPRGRLLPALAALAVATALLAVAALALAPRPAAPPEAVADVVGAPAPAAPSEPDAAVVEAPAPAWAAGQRRRCALTTNVEGEYQEFFQRVRLELRQRLDMRWDVVGVEDGVAAVQATIDGFSYHSIGRAAQGPVRWEVTYDPAEPDAADSPFAALLGAPLRLRLDVATGQVLEVTGAEEALARVSERAREDAPEDEPQPGRRGRPSPYRVPLLADRHALREALNGGLFVLPPPGDLPRRAWSRRREPEIAGPYWPQGVHAEVELSRGADGAVTWTGARTGTFRPPFLPEAQGTVERLIRGRATLTPAGDRVARATYKETWTTTLQGRPELGARAVYEVEVALEDP